MQGEFRVAEAPVEICRPRDAVRVKQIGDVGPEIRQRVAGKPGLAARARFATVHLGRIEFPAGGDPPRKYLEVPGLAPGRNRFVELILQHVVLRVGPIVGQVGPVVITHHVDRTRRRRRAAQFGIEDVRTPAPVAAPVRRLALLPQLEFALDDEAVHLAAVDLGDLVWIVVRSAVVARIVVGIR